jgi:hypothetical protein
VKTWIGLGPLLLLASCAGQPDGGRPHAGDSGLADRAVPTAGANDAGRNDDLAAADSTVADGSEIDLVAADVAPVDEAGTDAPVPSGAPGDASVIADVLGPEAVPRDLGTQEVGAPDAAGPDASLDLAGADAGAGLEILPLAQTWLDLHCRKPLEVKIRNGGTSASGPLTVNLVDPRVPGALTIAEDACTGHGLAPQEICTLGLSATMAGTFEVTVVVKGEPAADTQARLSIRAVYGDGPILEPQSGSSANFPPTPVGSSSQTYSYLLVNTGLTSLLVPAAALSGGAVQDFVIQDACSGRLVAPGDQCLILVRFQPTAVGVRSTTLQVVLHPDCDATTLSLTGTGIP